MRQDPNSPSNAHATSQASSAKAPIPKREFLTFTVGQEHYGMDIQCVQEIRSYESPTRMANTPTFINGVINLRGVIVPIVDMRILFNLASVVYDHFTVVIILNIRSHLVGMVVDSVSDVIALTPSQLRPAPEFTATVGRDHVMGIATVAERMLALLDIEKFMCSADMGLIWPDRQ